MYTPDWKGPIEGYVVNYLTREHWKIARTCPRDDAMQEAYCVFLRVKRKYPKLDAPQHFMALFKTAWYRQFTDLANIDTADRITCQMPVNEAGETYDPVGECDNDGFLAITIAQAPREVQMVLALFLNAPQELVEAALGSWRADARRKDGGESRHLNRLLGLPLEQDTLGRVAAYFG